MVSDFAAAPPVAWAHISWGEPSLVVAILALAVLYLRGWWQLRSELPARFPPARAGAFLAGTGFLLLALASPLDTMADHLLHLHMTQHLLLMMVVPPLILLAWPLAPLLRGLPFELRRSVARLIGRHPVRIAARGLTHPVICWLAFVLVTWVWHLPALYELALHDERWHDVEHVCFLATGLLFWWPVVQPWPSRSRWSRWSSVPYLLLACLQNGIFSAIFVFSDRVIYPSYDGPRPWGLSALADQALAGAIMWIPGSLAMLVPAVVIVYRLLEARSADPAVSAHSSTTSRRMATEIPPR
jgi:cytochrome c oxidase assembly factor CtaG